MNQAIDEHPITVNGKETEVTGSIDLPALLRRYDVDPEDARGIAVAVNDEVVPKRQWTAVTVAPGDRVEIVTAKQGG